MSSQHEPHLKPGVNSGTLERCAVPAPLGTLVYSALVQYPAINKLWGRQERDIGTDIIFLVVKVRS